MCIGGPGLIGSAFGIPSMGSEVARLQIFESFALDCFVEHLLPDTKL
jgi:hypothetical protein